MTQLIRFVHDLTPAQKTGLAIASGVALVVAGGAIVAAVVASDTMIIVAGPVVIATGAAAKILAQRA